MTISLDRYQELMTLPINAFNGLNKPDETPRYACSTIWKQSDRDNLKRYLYQAHDMREHELGYFLSPTYTVEEIHTNVHNPQTLKHKFIKAVGQRTSVAIEAEVILDHGVETAPNDPVTVTVATSVTNVSEIHVYKYDSFSRSYEVTPSYVNIVGGTATILIPRARLVIPDLLDDRDDHLDYYENDNFVEDIDVFREYADPSTGVSYVSDNCNSFTPNYQSGYADILDNRLSIINVFPATWSMGIATPLNGNCHGPYNKVKISYLSSKDGDDALDIQTIRLTHTLMPYEPCTCEPVHQYWLNDNVKDASNIVTPYGSSVAAVAVWIADSRSRIGYGTTVG